MKNEMNSLEEHSTWKLVDMPPGKKAVGCKWFFKIKCDPSGKIIKFKARLVAKGFTQRPGIDYNETFAPVARKESINTVLAIAAAEDLEAENVDVDTAFLDGEVEEEIYMDQPDGFEDEGSPKKKCLLQKVLYGTKQAARQWNNKLSQQLDDQEFKSSAADPCVFVRVTREEYIIIVIYVDDLMISCKTKEHIASIKNSLMEDFSIKDLGDLKYCLRIEIHRKREDGTIKMNQKAYIKRLSEKFGVENCKDVHTPADSNSKLIKMGQEEAFVPKYPYRELVGALMYIATCTRPDIAHAVGEVAKFLRALRQVALDSSKADSQVSQDDSRLKHRVQRHQQGRADRIRGCQLGWRPRHVAFDNKIRFLPERKRDIVEFEASTNGRDLTY
uniref:Reverse transcriptase Ty1/copia-type domain-containing protein n=1 Tax=Peronospora matthiolae TaxID=2874970 RepID=A0AAV1UD78_9STRA